MLTAFLCFLAVTVGVVSGYVTTKKLDALR